MRDVQSGLLAGLCVICLVAAGCSGAAPSMPNDQLVVGAGHGGGGVAGATAPVGSLLGLPNGPTAGLGVMMMTMTTAGTTAPIGAAGTAAPPTAGAAGAPRVGGSGGQAGTATAGGPSSQAGAGGVGTSGSGGAPGGVAGAAGAGATNPGDPCPLPLTTYVNDGVAVNGAGCKQQWEGIVMTQGGRGLCTAQFISDRHLMSAAHCYASDGTVSLQVSAPTWDNGMRHTFQADVKRSGDEEELDVSVIDLGKSVEWATPERRFVLHAGDTSAPVDLHMYGFGGAGLSGAAGTLRGVPKRATIRVTDNGKGALTGMAGEAQLCQGDSGGPAFFEKTAAVLYGVNQGADPPDPSTFATCAAPDWTIVLTNVSKYVSFIEKVLGKPCERKRVDDLDVAQCW